MIDYFELLLIEHTTNTIRNRNTVAHFIHFLSLNGTRDLASCRKIVNKTFYEDTDRGNLGNPLRLPRYCLVYCTNLFTLTRNCLTPRCEVLN